MNCIFLLGIVLINCILTIARGEATPAVNSGSNLATNSVAVTVDTFNFNSTATVDTADDNSTATEDCCQPKNTTFCTIGASVNHTCPLDSDICCEECDKKCEAVDQWFRDHRDNFCHSVGGICQYNSNNCYGTYENGMCGGPRARQCCVPKGTFSIPVAFFVVQVGLSILILFSNSLVVIVTVLDKKLHTVTFVGICCLALADILLATFWITIQALAFYHERLITAVNKDFRHFNDLAFVCEMSVILHILLITIERFVAIMFPMFHLKWVRNRRITIRKMLLLVLAIWALAALMAYTRRFNQEWMSCSRSTVFNLLRTFLPLGIATGLNLRLYWEIVERKRRRREMCENANTQQQCNETNTQFGKLGAGMEWKAARTVGIILICIFLAYGPLSIVTIASVCGVTPDLYTQASDWIVTAKLVNSLINPLIYAITTPQFQVALRKLISCRSMRYSVTRGTQ